MANDPTQDKDFLAAPPDRQHAYLMATDPDYAKAPSDRQQAYLKQFSAQPEAQRPSVADLNKGASIDPDTRGTLQRANDWYTRAPSYEGTLSHVGRSPREMAGDVGKAAAFGSLAPIAGGLAVAPVATALGVGGSLVGGAIGSHAGGVLGKKFGAPELGEDIGGLTGSVLGGGSGAKLTKLGPKIGAMVRDPLTGRVKTPYELAVDKIAPDPYAPESLPAKAIPKGTNYGQFLEEQKAAARDKPLMSKIPTGRNSMPKPQGGGIPQGSPTPFGNASEVPYGSLVKLPVPNEAAPPVNPKYMASVPRRALMGMGESGTPGAGTQLQQIGNKVLYIPEGGYAPPKSVSTMAETPQSIGVKQVGTANERPQSTYRPSEKAETMSEKPKDLGAEFSEGQVSHEIERNKSILRNPRATPEDIAIANQRLAEMRKINPRAFERGDVNITADRLKFGRGLKPGDYLE